MLAVIRSAMINGHRGMSRVACDLWGGFNTWERICIAVGEFSLCLKKSGNSAQILSPIKNCHFTRSLPWKEHIFLLSSGHHCPKMHAPKNTPINLQVTMKGFPSILPVWNNNSKRNSALNANRNITAGEGKNVYKPLKDNTKQKHSASKIINKSPWGRHLAWKNFAQTAEGWQNYKKKNQTNKGCFATSMFNNNAF